MLHIAATTGRLPVLDEQGNPSGNHVSLSSKQQLETLGYLVDKVIPKTLPTEEHLGPETPKVEAVHSDDVENLTMEELKQLAYAGEEDDSGFDPNS